MKLDRRIADDHRVLIVERLAWPQRGARQESAGVGDVDPRSTDSLADGQVQLARYSSELSGIDDEVPVAGVVVSIEPGGNVPMTNDCWFVVGEERAATDVIGRASCRERV